MKEQHRASQPESHSAGRKGSESQRGHQQGGRHDPGRWPGTSHSRSGEPQNKEDRRPAPFIPLDKDDIY